MNKILEIYILIQFLGGFIFPMYWIPRKNNKYITIKDTFMILIFPVWPLIMILGELLCKIYEKCKPILDKELFKLD